MPRVTGLPSLNLSAARRDDSRISNNPLSPHSMTSPHSPRSMPTSPLPQSAGSRTIMHPLSAKESTNNGLHHSNPASPRITAIPDFPSSPERDSAQHGKEPSRSFFSNLVASKSSHRLQSPEPSLPESNEKSSQPSRGSSRERNNHIGLQKKDSTPELPRMVASNGKPSGEFSDSQSQLVPPGSSDGTSIAQKKSRSKLGGILNRSKPTKLEDEKSRKPIPPIHLTLDNSVGPNGRPDQVSMPLKTAPLKADYRERAFGSENGSAARTRSADRGPEETGSLKKPSAAPSTLSSSLNERSMFSGIQHTGKGVGDRLGKAGKGLFNKITRSGSSTEREIPTEENYICTTINLPLVQQTRKTRIAKKLELSRDKTEFWMPALPWRCIDYLNMNGCEEEGLYRIPGSGREVKVWQKRFDTEFDINLFEEPDLYDINTIGSMFKSWLRELPDEILPKATQRKISQQCAGATQTPQLLKDELSKLPPFNYYLLFAITCHLSLLHSFAEKNKMDYRNLCICFQPCLRIDAFCFQFLVINWKECWQGCWTEHEYLQEEYRWERDGSITSGMDTSVDERAISSSSSNQIPQMQPQLQAQPHPHPAQSRSAEVGIQRKASAPHLYGKQRSMSSGTGSSPKAPGHANSSSLPTVPRVGTPDNKKYEQELPELEGLSPIRM